MNIIGHVLLGCFYEVGAFDYRCSQCHDLPVIFRVVRFSHLSPLPLKSGGTLGCENHDDFDAVV